jgi:hypothetical protein
MKEANTLPIKKQRPIGIGFEDLLAANVKMKKAIREAMAEIRYQHKDMLTAHERNHPRGSGWARVYDRLKQSISS